MALARPQEVEVCGARVFRHRLLQQPEVFGGEHDEMWPLACGNGFPPPGAQAGNERVLTRRRFVLASSDPDVWGHGWCPRDTPMQTPDAELLVARVTHHMHENGCADIAWIERGRVREHLQAIVGEGANPCSQAGDLLRTQDVLVCRAFCLQPACGLWQRPQPQG